jgi:hypothetical protein
MDSVPPVGTNWQGSFSRNVDQVTTGWPAESSVSVGVLMVQR